LSTGAGVTSPDDATTLGDNSALENYPLIVRRICKTFAHLSAPLILACRPDPSS
jgi:hypothetical protein